VTVADLISDGNTRVAVVASVSNINAPTTAELNAGVDISSLLTPDGLQGFEPDTADVDTSALNSTFNTNIPGRLSFSNTMLRFKKQSGTDTTYNLLVLNYAAYVVIRRGIAAATAWTASQVVEVYPIICGQVRNLAPEANSVQRYEIPTKISATPQIRATVA
jgi:hypothetical protein